LWIGRVHSAQELHKLLADFGRGLVLYPVADIVEFEIPDEARKAGVKLFRRRIKRPQTIGLSRNVKRGLGYLRAFPGSGQVEIEFGGAIVVQCPMKTGALEFRYVVSHIIRFYP
jgi:hypothetical protein